MAKLTTASACVLMPGFSESVDFLLGECSGLFKKPALKPQADAVFFDPTWLGGFKGALAPLPVRLNNHQQKHNAHCNRYSIIKMRKR